MKAYSVHRGPQPISLQLDANESAPPPLDDWSVSPEEAARYPDAGILERALAERLDVAPERVLVTAGGDEAIDRFLRVAARGGRQLLLPTPTFEMIPRYAELSGLEVARVPWEADWPLDAVLAASDERTAAVAVVSPNNPTGRVVAPHTLERLAAALPGVPLLVDLAYAEFADEDLVELALGIDQAVQVRTLSKAFGLAGLRVGYAVGTPQRIAALRAAGGPYPVAAPSLTLARRALASGVASALVDGVRARRASLTARLEALGADVTPSQANFVLARFDDAALVRDALRGLGVSVRAFEDEPALAGRLRITVPSDEAGFERLCAALDTALSPQALLFDLDGVLVDVSRSYREAIRRTAAGYGVALDAAAIAAAKRRGDANDDWSLTQRLLAERGVERPLAEVTTRFEALYQGTAGQPGLRLSETALLAPDALRTLGRRFRIGAVTGRPRVDALDVLERLELVDAFDVVVAREDAPQKPDPAPVRLALERLGVVRAWMYGDTVDDVRAARAAGVVPFGVVAGGVAGGRGLPDGVVPADAPTGGLALGREDVDALLAAGAARVAPTLDPLLPRTPTQLSAR